MIGAQGEITPEARATARNMSAAVLLKIAQYPFLVLSVLLVPRSLGPQAYGEYALVLSIIVMAASTTELGLGEICGRFVQTFEIKGDQRSLKRFASGLLATKLALDAVLFGPLLFLIWSIYGDRFPLFYYGLMIAILVVSDLGVVPYGLMFGMNRLTLYALRHPLRRVLTLVLVLTLYHYFGLYGALASAFLVEAILTALNLAWGWRFLSLKDLRLDFKFLKPYLQFGFIFYVSNGVIIIWQKVGNPIVAHFTMDSSEVALFDIPNQIFLITTSFFLVTIGYLVPIFVRLLATGKEEKLVTWSNLLLKYIFALSTLMVGGFLIAGHEFIPVLIGRQYSAIYPNAMVLLMGTFPMIVVQLGHVFCIIYKKARNYLFALACALLTFVVAASVLVPHLASMGASLAMLLSTGVAAFALGVIFWQQVKPCLQEGLQVALIGVVFIPFWFLRRNLIIDLLLAIAAGILYLAILLITRKLRIEEMLKVIQAIRLQPSAQV